MLSKLLSTNKTTHKIEVMDDNDEFDEEEELQNWEIEQEINEQPLLNDSTYGFANRQQDIFQRLSEEASELFELYNVAQITNQNRQKERLLAEQEKFDEEHYLADLFDPPEALLAAHQYQIELSEELTDNEKATLVSIKSSIAELSGSEVCDFTIILSLKFDLFQSFLYFPIRLLF